MCERSSNINRGRQEDEIFAISSIYDHNEFSFTLNEKIDCLSTIFPNLPVDRLRITCVNVHHEDFYVEHLPPVRLNVRLPFKYPSERSPIFALYISWLPPWEISLVCQRLDEIWQENRGSEILFLWLEFLKNDLFAYLGIKETLDVSFLCMIHETPTEYVAMNLKQLTDRRAFNRALLLDPKQYLTKYNEEEHMVKFEKGFYICCICFEEHSGQKCFKLRTCDHVYCRDCMRQYIATKINEAAVKSITCPDLECTCEITENDIKRLCPELFSKYENLMLKVTLNTMNDIVYCPRTSCQSPVLRDSEETLATCSTCGYNFCAYCQKVYHGVAPCFMTTEDSMKLVRDYQNSNHYEKKLLERRYGRRQIQTIVEKYLTNEYLKENAKACPNCQTLITKIDGCNKMMCVHCQASFCWLCGVHITASNAYDHFLIDGSRCFKRLFEGIIPEDIDVFEE